MFGTMTKEDIVFLIGDLVLCNAESPTVSEKIVKALNRVEEIASPDVDKQEVWQVLHDIENAFISLADDYIVAAFFCGVALAKDPLSLFEPMELARLKAKLLQRRERRRIGQEEQDSSEDTQAEDA